MIFWISKSDTWVRMRPFYIYILIFTPYLSGMPKELASHTYFSKKNAVQWMFSFDLYREYAMCVIPVLSTTYSNMFHSMHGLPGVPEVAKESVVSNCKNPKHIHIFGPPGAEVNKKRRRSVSPSLGNSKKDRLEKMEEDSDSYILGTPVVIKKEKGVDDEVIDLTSPSKV